MAIAGCMSGLDAARAEALPGEIGERNEVVIQLGHMCTYGAPISTAIELTGARVRPIGQSTQVADYQLEGALNENTAAALYVVSHHVVHYGQIPFERFVEIAHAKHVPVIVDAASEYDLHRFIKGGADCVVYSGHKFLGGPTSGIVAGKRALIKATYLQNIGVGRGMKVGKESIAGCIAAMGEWMKRDHAAIRAQEDEVLNLWVNAVAGLAGVEAQIVPDPTGNPLQRLQVNIDKEIAGASAASFARVLGEQDPAIMVRNHEVELGYFQLDPCNLVQGQAELVAKTLSRVLGDGQNIIALKDDLAQARNAGIQGYMNWLNDLD
jgi:L-seryl-tRNA(Ser) seleniumtransferase